MTTTSTLMVLMMSTSCGRYQQWWTLCWRWRHVDVDLLITMLTSMSSMPSMPRWHWRHQCHQCHIDIDVINATSTLTSSTVTVVTALLSHTQVRFRKKLCNNLIVQPGAHNKVVMHSFCTRIYYFNLRPLLRKNIIARHWARDNQMWPHCFCIGHIHNRCRSIAFSCSLHNLASTAWPSPRSLLLMVRMRTAGKQETLIGKGLTTSPRSSVLWNFN
jgi:hypothetical protein